MTTYSIMTESDLADGIELARQALSRGEAVAFPVEHGYVVAVEPFSQEAVYRLQEARGASGSALPVLVGAHQTLDGVAKPFSAEVRNLLIGLWPGLLTVMVPAAVPWDLGDGGSGWIALRQPNDPIALALLSHGPLAATAAARAGGAALSATEVEQELGELVSVILDGGPREVGPASTIVQIDAGALAVVREGAISESDIAARLGARTGEPGAGES